MREVAAKEGSGVNEEGGGSNSAEVRRETPSTDDIQFKKKKKNDMKCLHSDYLLYLL